MQLCKRASCIDWFHIVFFISIHRFIIFFVNMHWAYTPFNLRLRSFVRPPGSAFFHIIVRLLISSSLLFIYLLASSWSPVKDRCTHLSFAPLSKLVSLVPLGSAGLHWCWHYLVHSGYPFISQPFTINKSVSRQSEYFPGGWKRRGIQNVSVFPIPVPAIDITSRLHLSMALTTFICQRHRDGLTPKIFWVSSRIRDIEGSGFFRRWNGLCHLSTSDFKRRDSDTIFDRFTPQ